MGLSEFTFRLILLFLPGLIAFWVIDSFTFYNTDKLWKHLLNSFLLGIVCYGVYFLITLIPSFGLDFHFLDALTDSTNDTKNLSINEILIVTVIGVGTGLFISYIINRKWTRPLAVLLGRGQHDVDEDVWTILVNSPETNAWVNIKDFENDLVYRGWIDRASEAGESKELFLKDVTVEKMSTGEHLYQIHALYLSRPREKLDIEIHEANDAEESE